MSDEKKKTPATEQPVTDDQPTEEQGNIIEEIAPPTPAEAIKSLTEIMSWANKSVAEDELNEGLKTKWQATIDLASSALIGDLHQVKELTAANTKLTEEVDRQKTLVLIAKRKTEAAQAETEDEKAKAQTHSPLEPGELTALKTENKLLKDEITRLKQGQQRPLVETLHLTRKITTDPDCETDRELSGYIAQGWHEVPALCGIFTVEDYTLMQRIGLRRTNQQPIQPHYTAGLTTEIDKNFDAQGNRENPILQPSPTPYTDLILDGHPPQSIIDACDAKALKDARNVFNASGSLSKAVDAINIARGR